MGLVLILWALGISYFLTYYKDYPPVRDYRKLKESATETVRSIIIKVLKDGLSAKQIKQYFFHKMWIR